MSFWFHFFLKLIKKDIFNILDFLSIFLSTIFPEVPKTIMPTFHLTQRMRHTQFRFPRDVNLHCQFIIIQGIQMGGLLTA